MAIKFTGAGSIRLITDRNSHDMSIYGIADRYAYLDAQQWWAGIFTGPTSTYTESPPGAVANDDAQINGLAYKGGELDLHSVREWGMDPQKFADAQNGQLFAFAIIGYFENGQRVTKYAIRKLSDGVLHTTERRLGGLAWSNAKLVIGAGSGNSNPSRMRISKLTILNTNLHDDAAINARMDALGTNDAAVISYLSGFGADINAALVDGSGNGNNWTLSGEGVEVDDSHQTADAFLLTGKAIMPTTAPVAGPGPAPAPAAPAAPTGVECFHSRCHQRAVAVQR